MNLRKLIHIASAAAAIGLCSLGCPQAAAASDAVELPLTVNGEARSAFISLPDHPETGKIWPLVIGFHGGGGNAEGYMRQSHLPEKALRAGFVAACPEGTPFIGNHRVWNSGPEYVRATGGVDDVAFVRALIDAVAARIPIDRKRVYATGFSNGAQFSYRLALELSDEIAAIAPMSGALSADGAHPGRPVPVLHFHGTADSVYPLEGGLGTHSIGRTPHVAINSAIAQWIAFNRAAIIPTLVSHEGWREARHDGPAPVTLVLIEGMGHQIAGGDDNHLPQQAMRAEPDAIALALSFFAAHPMP